MNVTDFIASERAALCVSKNVHKYIDEWVKVRGYIGSLDVADPAVISFLSRSIRPVSWNSAAFLFGPFWGVWRGCLHAWPLMIIFLITLFPEILSTAFNVNLVRIEFILRLLNFAIFLTFGMYGNKWYLARLIVRRSDDVRSLKPSLFRLFSVLGALFVILFASKLAVG